MDGDGEVEEGEGMKNKELERKGARGMKEDIQKKTIRRTQSVDIWPRKSRTDITILC